MKINEIKGELGQNFASGLVVFLVALPLCLGIALASGAPPLSGIIAGIIGGIIVGAISNSHISVSGPAAGLTAIIVTAILTPLLVSWLYKRHQEKNIPTSLSN